MAETPRKRTGPKKVRPLTEGEMAVAMETAPRDPQPPPRRTRPRLAPRHAEPLVSADYLEGIARMAEANVPLEAVLRDFRAHVLKNQRRGISSRELDAEEAALVRFYKHLLASLPELPEEPGRVKLVAAQGPDVLAPARTPERMSELHQFPWWDPRGHMIDLMAEEDNDGKPASYTISKKIVDRAKEGDMDASAMLFNYTIGKPTQHVEMTTNQNINHYDVSADPVAFEVVVREDDEDRKSIEHDD